MLLPGERGARWMRMSTVSCGAEHGRITAAILYFSRCLVEVAVPDDRLCAGNTFCPVMGVRLRETAFAWLICAARIPFHNRGK